jgi:small subunit ribosomal protein S17
VEQLIKTPKGGKKVFTGRVVSDKMNKTVVVEITKRTVHRLYKKYVTSTKRVHAHDENNEAHEGDTVRIVEARPISKKKAWRVLEIVARAR